MTSRTGGRPSLTTLAENPALRAALIDHARRSLVVQLFLRGVLIAYDLLTVAIAPPTVDRAASLTVIGLYAVLSVTAFRLAGRGSAFLLPMLWVAPFIDVLALGSLALFAIGSDGTSQTSGILLAGFVVIPVITATQLRLWVCVVVLMPTVVVYAVCSVLATGTGAEAIASVLLRTFILVAVSFGCGLLVLGQRFRVLRIGRLVQARENLLEDLLHAEVRERERLSEALHDHALQYVLAARQDLEDLDGHADPVVVQRLEQALAAASGSLRATVTELHPAVLAQAGLATALGRIARDSASRGDLTLALDTDAWTRRSPLTETLLFDTARELLSNVVKHAAATHVEVVLRCGHVDAELIVSDDGSGMSADSLAGRLRDGHIGLASRRTRIEAAGGTLVVGAGIEGRGTSVAARVPLVPTPLRS